MSREDDLVTIRALVALVEESTHVPCDCIGTALVTVVRDPTARGRRDAIRYIVGCVDQDLQARFEAQLASPASKLGLQANS